jgi:hypothetical protein
MGRRPFLVTEKKWESFVVTAVEFNFGGMQRWDWEWKLLVFCEGFIVVRDKRAGKFEEFTRKLSQKLKNFRVTLSIIWATIATLYCFLEKLVENIIYSYNDKPNILQFHQKFMVWFPYLQLSSWHSCWLLCRCQLEHRGCHKVERLEHFNRHNLRLPRCFFIYPMKQFRWQFRSALHLEPMHHRNPLETRKDQKQFHEALNRSPWHVEKPWNENELKRFDRKRRSQIRFTSRQWTGAEFLIVDKRSIAVHWNNGVNTNFIGDCWKHDFL